MSQQVRCKGCGKRIAPHVASVRVETGELTERGSFQKDDLQPTILHRTCYRRRFGGVEVLKILDHQAADARVAG